MEALFSMVATFSADKLYTPALQGVIPPFDWAVFAPDIEKILELKHQKGAVILAHNYQTPEIFYGVADIVGDSLALAREAQKTSAQILVVCGVFFMAETAKILNPEKTVLIPDTQAGCSLASSIEASDVAALREKYPGVPIIGYVNTSAAVKAECDACCTSSNVLKVVESFGEKRVILLPDQYLAANTQSKTNVEIISWAGQCEVHELFSAQDVAEVRAAHEGVFVLSHPECPREVVEASDFSGSTSAMMHYISEHKPKKVALLTECSMSDNIAVENQGVEFIKPCNLCPHMKKITLPKIRTCLETLTPEVEVAPEIAVRARQALRRMLEV